MGSSHTLDQLEIAFDDTHAVASAGLLLPATLAARRDGRISTSGRRAAVSLGPTGRQAALFATDSHATIGPASITALAHRSARLPACASCIPHAPVRKC